MKVHVINDQFKKHVTFFLFGWISAYNIYFQVVITDVLDGGKFYIQAVADQKMASIQQKLASLKLSEAPIIGEFNPKKGDLVLAQFSQDNSWNRALVSESDSFKSILDSLLLSKLSPRE